MPSNDFEKDRTGPIKSSYVPPFGLQGQEFSCHVTWDPDYSLSSMNIKLEDGVSFKHIYNVGLDSINSTEEKEVEKLCRKLSLNEMYLLSPHSNPARNHVLFFPLMPILAGVPYSVQ